MKRSKNYSFWMIIAFTGILVILFSGCSKELDKPDAMIPEKSANESANLLAQKQGQYVANEILVKFKLIVWSLVGTKVNTRV